MLLTEQSEVFLSQPSRPENAKINFGRISICLEILVDEDYIDEEYLLNTSPTAGSENIDRKHNYLLFRKESTEKNNIAKINEEYLNHYGYCFLTHSYETDLFSYKYQNTPPYYTKCYSRNELKIEFSDSAFFISEGRKEHVTSDSARQVNMVCNVSYTYFFNSKLRVWHLALTPSENEFLTEIETIKIMKLFSGIQEKGKVTDRDFVDVNFLNFIDGDKKSTKLNDLFEYATGIRYKFNKLAPETSLDQLLTSGIVSIDLKYNTYPEFGNTEEINEKLKPIFKLLFENVKKIKVEDLAADDPNIADILNTLCGITLGIFDFDRMSIEEITDTLNPLEKSIKKTSFLTVNRGVLSSYSLADETLESAINKQGISPYLIIPSAVLAHNDYVSRDAEKKINFIWNDLSTNVKRNLNGLIDERDGIDDLINDDILPNVFQYPTEQEIYSYGMIHRGIKERIDEVRSKLVQLDKLIEVRQTKQSLSNEKWIQSILTILSISQIISVLADYNSFWGTDKIIGSVGILRISWVLLFVAVVIVWMVLRNTKVNSNRKKSDKKKKLLKKS